MRLNLYNELQTPISTLPTTGFERIEIINYKSRRLVNQTIIRQLLRLATSIRERRLRPHLKYRFSCLISGYQFKLLLPVVIGRQ